MNSFFSRAFAQAALASEVDCDERSTSSWGSLLDLSNWCLHSRRFADSVRLLDPACSAASSLA